MEYILGILVWLMIGVYITYQIKSVIYTWPGAIVCTIFWPITFITLAGMAPSPAKEIICLLVGLVAGFGLGYLFS